jgi:hypothetical protein
MDAGRIIGGFLGGGAAALCLAYGLKNGRILTPSRTGGGGQMKDRETEPGAFWMSACVWVLFAAMGFTLMASGVFPGLLPE